MSEQSKKLVLVVHGVGSPKPGVTMEEFEAAVSAYRGDSPRSQSLRLTCDESSEEDRQVKRLVIPAIEQEDETLCLRFAEVNWTDLSSVGSSTVGLVWSFFELILHMYDARDKAIESDESQTSWRVRAGDWVRWLLHGPVVALNVQMLVCVICVAAAKLLTIPAEVDEVGRLIVCLSGVLLALIARVIVRRWSGWSNLDFWGIATGLTVATLAFFSHLTPIERFINPGAIDIRVDDLLTRFALILVAAINVVWGLIGLAVLVMATATYVKPSVKDSHRAAFLMTIVPAAVWGMLVPILWVAGLAVLPSHLKLASSEGLLEYALLLIGLVIGNLTIAGVVAGVSWRLRSWSDGRFIVHWLLEAAAVLATVLWASIATWFAVSLIFLITGTWKFSNLASLREVSGEIIVLLGVIGAGAAALTPGLAMALGLVMDVVNYFRVETDTPVGDGTRGAKIRERLVNTLLAARADCSQLIIVAHSQGTVITLDVLASPEVDQALHQFQKVTLITMGSPFSHLYQYYFPACYPHLNDQNRWSLLGDRVDVWENIYRPEDFVGTEITSGDGGGFPMNTMVASNPDHANGHTGYFSDKRVLPHILMHLCGDQ